jgi:hypothetical protein
VPGCGCDPLRLSKRRRRLFLIKRSQIDNGALTAAGMLTGIEMKVGAALIPIDRRPGNGPRELAKGNHIRWRPTRPRWSPACARHHDQPRGRDEGAVTFDGMARAPPIEAPDIDAARTPCRRVVEMAPVSSSARTKDPPARSNTSSHISSERRSCVWSARPATRWA